MKTNSTTFFRPQTYSLLLGSMAVLFALFFFLLSACQSRQNEREDHTGAQKGPVAVLEDQVLAIHDSIMPAMSELLKLKKAVAAQTQKQPQERVREQGRAIGRRLDEADEGMMSWMNQYDGDSLRKLDEAKALAYLRDQHIRVLRVRDQMRQSIIDAQAYLHQ